MGSISRLAKIVSIASIHCSSTIPLADPLRSYSTSDEIQAYMEKVVDDYNLRDFFKLRHEVVGARWNPETCHWIITIRRNGNDNDVFEDWCDVFVNGSGGHSRLQIDERTTT